MNPAQGQTLRGLVARFVVGALLLAGLVMAFGEHLEAAVLPWFGTVLRIADPAHRVEHLGLQEGRTGRIIHLTVTRVRYVFVGDRALEPHATATASASTLVGNVRLTLVLVLASAFAHRTAGWLRTGLLLMLAGVAAVLSLALDVPLLLASEIRGLYQRAYDPQGWSPLLAWSNFLLDGGRFALPLALGYLAGRCATHGGWPGTGR